MTTVGTVTASDPDAGDDITGLEIAGGVDNDRFSFSGGVTRVAAASAQLMFRPPPPDHENPMDAASTVPVNPAGNNQYVVEFTATSGADSLTATQTVVVTVTDADEPPPRPDAPTVAPAGPNTLTVDWNAPDPTGMEPINGYNVRYREVGAPGWTNAFYDGTVTATAVGGLTTGTTYEVQVQAVNEEGQSGWSDSGTGTPAAGPPRITNPGSKTYIQGQRIPAFAITVDGDGGTPTVSVDGLPAGLTYNAGTGLVSGTVSPTAEARAYIVTIRANDGVTPQVTTTFSITVWPAAPERPVGGGGSGGGGGGGAAPAVLVGFPNNFIETAAEVSEGSSTVLTVELSRMYPRAITVRITAVPGTADADDYAPFTAADLTINPGETSGTVSVAIADDGLPEDEEEFALRLTLAGAPPGVVLNTAAATVKVIIPANGPPPQLSFGLAVVADSVLMLGGAARIELPEASGGTGPVTYTLTPALPAGLTFNAADRTITGTPSEAAGPISFTYTATDAEGVSVMLTFNITVEAPTLTPEPTPTPRSRPVAVAPRPIPKPTAAAVAPRPIPKPTAAAVAPTPVPKPTAAAVAPTPAPEPTAVAVAPTPLTGPASTARVTPEPATAPPTPEPAVEVDEGGPSLIILWVILGVVAGIGVIGGAIMLSARRL